MITLAAGLPKMQVKVTSPATRALLSLGGIASPSSEEISELMEMVDTVITRDGKF